MLQPHLVLVKWYAEGRRCLSLWLSLSSRSTHVLKGSSPTTRTAALAAGANSAWLSLSRLFAAPGFPGNPLQSVRKSLHRTPLAPKREQRPGSALQALLTSCHRCCCLQNNAWSWGRKVMEIT